MHGGGPKVVAGTPLPHEYQTENLELVEKGCENLVKHIKNLTEKFGIPVITAINRFTTDSDAELDLIAKIAKENGSFDSCICTHWADGGKGAEKLALSVVEASASFKKIKHEKFKFLYPLELPIKEKIEIIVKDYYGGAAVEYSELAEKKIELYTKQGFSSLPICMAKTHLSLSADPTLFGVPTGFTITIRDIRSSVGAGFLYPICGSIMTLPALSIRPAYYDVDIDFNTGKIVGLF